MKNLNIQPLSGYPSQFRYGNCALDVEPLLELLFKQGLQDLARNLDEIMYLLVELNALAEDLDTELMYDSCVNLRGLRDAFRAMQVPCVTLAPQRAC